MTPYLPLALRTGPQARRNRTQSRPSPREAQTKRGHMRGPETATASDTRRVRGQHAPTGIRIPVAALKGLCPRPLDDGGSIRIRFYHRRIGQSNPEPTLHCTSPGKLPWSPRTTATWSPSARLGRRRKIIPAGMWKPLRPQVTEANLLQIALDLLRLPHEFPRGQIQAVPCHSDARQMPRSLAASSFDRTRTAPCSRRYVGLRWVPCSIALGKEITR